MENKVEKYVHDEFGELEVMQVGDSDPEISGAWVTIDFEKMRREAE